MIKLVALLVIAWAVWRFLRPRRVRPPAAPMRLDEREARAVLGVGPQADADAIRAAHRRLLVGVHPDRGGSAELTGQVNAARDLLLTRPGRS